MGFSHTCYCTVSCHSHVDWSVYRLNVFSHTCYCIMSCQSYMESIRTSSCADLLNVDIFHCIVFLKPHFLNITTGLKGKAYFGDTVKLMVNIASQSSCFRVRGWGLWLNKYCQVFHLKWQIHCSPCLPNTWAWVTQSCLLLFLKLAFTTRPRMDLNPWSLCLFLLSIVITSMSYHTPVSKFKWFLRETVGSASHPFTDLLSSERRATDVCCMCLPSPRLLKRHVPKAWCLTLSVRQFVMKLPFGPSTLRVEPRTVICSAALSRTLFLNPVLWNMLPRRPWTLAFCSASWVQARFSFHCKYWGKIQLFLNCNLVSSLIWFLRPNKFL